MSPIGSKFEVVSLEESRQLPYFMLIDDTDMHTLIEAVNFSIQFYQNKLGEILRERVAKLERGRSERHRLESRYARQATSHDRPPR